MFRWRWVLVGAMTSVMAGGGYLAVHAQETETAAAVSESPADEESAEQTAEEDLLDADALDDLVAPIALYPDALLAQIFVAATFPLDVVKADRFIDDNPDLGDKDRADQAAAEDWDPSIATLVGGFPTVVGRMADDLDWTEDLGDAVLAQTDGVLDAVQRMRSRAVAAGTLTSNEAQVVDDEGDNIAIEPADPNVVYVPSYDATTAYTAPAEGTVVTAPVATTTTGLTTGNILTTGAIAFGSALLIDEIFDDDDDHDYWYGPSHIDWDDDEFYPRRGGVNVEGDVNIDRDRNRVRVNDRDQVRVNGGDRTTLGDGDRTRVGGGDHVRIGDNDRDRVDRAGAWKPDPKKQADAREKLAARQGGGRNTDAVQAKLKARDANAGAGASLGARADSGDARAKLDAAGAKRKAAGGGSSSAFKPGDKGKAGSAAAANRGKASASKAKLPQASKPKPKVSKAAASRPKAVSRPQAAKAKAPPRKASPKASTFKKSQSGGKAKKASARGKSSHGKRRH